jgi:hypothetical protein
MQYGTTDAMTRPLPTGPFAGYPAGPHPSGAHAAAGYDEYEDEYGAPGYGYPPPPPRPPWYARPKVLLAVAAAVLVTGGGFYAAYSFTQTALGAGTAATSASAPQVPAPQPQASAPATDEPSPDPSTEPSADPSTEPSAAAPSAQAPPPNQQIAPFQDDQLRAFAGRVAGNNACTGTASTLQNVNEIVTCALGNGATVRYLRFTDNQARDQYKSTVRAGLDGRLDIRRNAVWSQRGRNQGSFISGNEQGNTAYVYWDAFAGPVSGEVVVPNSDVQGAERFWRRVL